MIDVILVVLPVTSTADEKAKQDLGRLYVTMESRYTPSVEIENLRALRTTTTIVTIITIGQRNGLNIGYVGERT